MRELAFYGRHHSNATNWLLHAICVPLEWAAFLTAIAAWSRAAAIAVQLVVAAYTAPLRPPWTAYLAAPQFALSFVACGVVQAAGKLGSIAAALAMWSVAWAVQVPVGHWLLEGNQPGMATQLTANSIVLSVAMAWDPHRPLAGETAGSQASKAR